MNAKMLNTSIVKAFEKINTFSYFDGAKGDSIDNMIVNTIKKYCPSITVIELPEWKTLQTQELYKPIKNKTQEVARTKICNCLNLKFTCCYDNPLLIRQPNNTQQWPDILIIYKIRGMAAEVKSSKQDQIIWNSGLPRKNGIYIYNGGLSTKINNSPDTTYFMGQHIITDMEQELLYTARDENHKISKLYNDKLIGSKWSLYARPMFNYIGKFLGNENRIQRESEVIEFINCFQWE